MKSYVSIDRIEGNFAVCEVELIDFERSKPDDFDKPTEFVDIYLEQINVSVGDVKEGDIIVIEHDENGIIDICYKDEAEKQRRIDVLKAIME